MTDQLKTIQDDIAFLKSLAQEGRGPAVLGGAIMVTAGSVFGAASLIHWAVQSGAVAASPWAYPIIWIAAFGLFMVILNLLKARIGGFKTGANRASGVAWAGVGWTIFALSGSIAIVAWRTHSAIPTLLFPPIILSLYGLGWMVAAAVSGRRWIWLTSLGAYGLALVAAWFSMTSAVMLIFAAAMVLLAIVPGVALVRNAPAGA